MKKTSDIREDRIGLLRSAIEHRATWFYLMLDEIRKRGMDIEEIGRAAVFRCGCFHGAQKLEACSDPKDLREFSKVFADDTYHRIFEMEMVEETEDRLSIDFHYCPLVAAWQKVGATDQELPLLCDMAMDGDRGIVSRFDGYQFDLEGTIAEGKEVCAIRVRKS